MTVGLLELVKAGDCCDGGVYGISLARPGESREVWELVGSGEVYAAARIQRVNSTLPREELRQPSMFAGLHGCVSIQPGQPMHMDISWN